LPPAGWRLKKQVEILPLNRQISEWEQVISDQVWPFDWVTI
jgi:hypothetical protein